MVRAASRSPATMSVVTPEERHSLTSSRIRSRGPHSANLVHESVGYGRFGFRLAAGEVEILDLLRRLLVAVAARDVVVEVAAARAHAADVQREPGLHARPARGDVVTDDHRDHRHDVEGRGRRAAGAEARLQPLAEHRHAPYREERRNPAIGDLCGEGDVLGADRGQVNGQVGPPVQNRLEGLAQARCVGARIGDLVVVAAMLHRLLPPEDVPHDRDVLARALERPAERLAVPSLDHLRS